ATSSRTKGKNPREDGIEVEGTAARGRMTMRSRGRRAPARPHRARRGLVTQVSHRRWVGEGYLGFGVVGFVVVLEQQAPQQFPHLHAIRATSTRCCPDSTGR